MDIFSIDNLLTLAMLTLLQAVLGFDNLFGDGAGQIPVGAEIVSATLTYTGFDPGVTAAVHEMLTDWDESDSLTSLFL